MQCRSVENLNALEEIPRIHRDYLEDSSCRIVGREVKIIKDIRQAPGGDFWKGAECKIYGQQILIRVYAAATDVFTLYFEEAKLGSDKANCVVGMVLDALDRRDDSLSWKIVSFRKPENLVAEALTIKILLPALTCPREGSPEYIKGSIEIVAARKERSDHQYLIQKASIIENQLHLEVKHHFAMQSFVIECETNTTRYNHWDLSYYKLELFGIKEHAIEECVCQRKNKVISTVVFDLATLPELVEKVNLWGPNRTDMSVGMLNFDIKG